MKRAVLKFGGEVVAEPEKLAAVLADVASLTQAGWKFLLCHGGGPQGSALAERLGLPTRKVGGRRVTDDATLQVMKQVLAGEVNVEVTAAALGAGLRGVGISGVSDALVSADKRPPIVVSGGGDAPVDFGWVGRIQALRVELINHLWAGGFTPVLNTLAVEGEGARRQVFNINADTVASALAAALGVDHLFLMTGVPGVLRDKDDPSTRIPTMTRAQANQAIADGVIVGGMIPKVENALARLEEGVGAVHILGASGGALQKEADAPGACGTVLFSN